MERKVVVVAPTYNEEKNIAAFIEAVLRYPVRLVIADSHSHDQTPAMIKKYPTVVYLDVVKRGLGLGLKEGINYAFNRLGADAVITMEADLSSDMAKLPEFLSGLKKYDLVIGSRYAPGGGVRNWSWWRKILSRSANALLRLLSGAWEIHEFTNLYRGFNRKVWEKVKEPLAVHQGWLFVPAFIFEALPYSFPTKEVPFVFVDRPGGESKMNTVSYTFALLNYALRFRLKKSAAFFKFLVVGGLGFIINTAVLVAGVGLGMTPANAGILGAELAIISNFFWNNLWTFSDRKLTSWTKIPGKFITFNFLSFGSALIQYAFLKAGELIFGLARYKGPIVEMPLVRLVSWYMIFYVAGVGVGLIWNYFMYSRVIWRKKSVSG
jgi:dolichol-phosphate mannosyltransferase